MMTAIFLLHSKRLIFCLLIIGFSSSVLLSQKNLSGNLNQPMAHIISIPASDRVIVDDVTGFSASNPDTVLVIQMQGVGINTPTTGYGYIQSIFGQPGLHEFMIIQSINTVTKEIVFRNNLLNTYDPKGNIQVVRVPYYNNVTITGKLFCNPWNSTTKKGGVLTFVIGRTLKLNADIDVSNSGFAGGKDTIGVARCAMVAPTTILDYYARSFTNAGFKGEGISIHDDFGTLLAPLHMKGQGPNFTSGGGGNGRFSGGGGGSNHGAGGIGGFEDNICAAPQSGGYGGFKSEQPTQPLFINRIFFGGGGGASTSLTGLSPSGGNGGGIIIIVSDTIIGNGGKMLANGGSGGTAVLNGGSGGGGGGGSIALSLRSYGSSPLSFYALGGNGGDNPNGFGEGAGGGGGFIYLSTNATGNTTSFLNGGLPGDYPSSSATAGGTGEQRVSFKAVLNGFLYNSISSSVTGNQVDSICSNIKPPKINGTVPVGGKRPYTYLWQKSYDQATWTNVGTPADSITYTPPNTPEIVTVYFRRTVTDNSSTPLVDISKSVKIIVQPAITLNNIGKDTTICHGQNPLPIGSIPANSTPSNGNGIYRYKWLQNLTNSAWDTMQVAEGVINGKNYDPPSLTQPTYYKRFVQSGRCIDYSPTVTITVLNSITGNSITRSDSVICEGFVFPPLSATTPGQGDGTNYAFQWQDSINSSSWNPASGSYSGPTYTPDTSKFSALVQKRFYRRIVLSGPHNVCKSTSLPIDMTRYPKIKNNLIIANPADLTICSGSSPVALPGSNPTDGAGVGSYSFIWQQSANGTSFNAAVGVNNSATGNYQPPSLTDTTWYRRIVNSGVYKTAVVCTNTSQSARINVHKPISNNIISVSGGGTNETICNNQQPGTYLGSVATGGTNIAGSYVYQWMSSPDNSVFTPVPIAGTGVNYSPSQLTATTYYQRQVTSGACVTNSNSITETVLPLITNNVISGKARVCYTMVPDPVTGGALAGGSGTYKYFWWQSIDGGTNWAAASGTNTSSTYQPPALLAPIKYERTVTSGPNDCCSNTSNVFDIGIDPLPSSTIYAGPDALTLKSILSNYQMQAAKPLTGETGLWKVLNGAGILYDSTSYNTTVGNLSLGGNSFLWTVSNGLCKLSDTVNIELLKIKEPQGFSPNGDTHNDTFIIEGLNLVDNDADLIIVNGAGTEVFKTSSRNNQTWTDWNGKNSAGFDLPEGTYYYMLNITAKDPKGTHHKLSGFIVLKRYK